MPSLATPYRRSIELRRRIDIPAHLAVAVLESAPGEAVGVDGGRVWTDTEAHARLGAELLAGMHVERPVRIGVGPLIEDDDATVLPVWWEDAEHPNLFPTFDGGLELRGDEDGTEMRLVGSYQPPLGALGRFGDGLAGHRVVMASLERFLVDVAGRLAAAAGEAAEAGSRPPSD